MILDTEYQHNGKIEDYEHTEPKSLGRICAECYHFTKKGIERKCECEQSDYFEKPVHSTQENCDCFIAYWW